MRKLTTQIGFYLGTDLANKVKDKCHKENRPISEIVRSLLRAWLKGKIEV